MWEREDAVATALAERFAEAAAADDWIRAEDFARAAFRRASALVPKLRREEEE